MYAGVPDDGARRRARDGSTSRARVDGSSTRHDRRSRCASPKSSDAHAPSSPTITLSGLKSRCTSPAACAAASPRPACDVSSASTSRHGARRSRDPAPQRLALDELHRDEDTRPRCVADVVDRDDVRMGELRERPRLAEQSRLRRRAPRVVDDRAHQLHRDLAIELGDRGRRTRRPCHRRRAGGSPRSDRSSSAGSVRRRRPHAPPGCMRAASIESTRKPRSSILSSSESSATYPSEHIGCRRRLSLTSRSPLRDPVQVTGGAPVRPPPPSPGTSPPLS